MSYKPWYEVSKGYEGCDLVPLNSGNSFKVGDVIDGDIVYKVDDGYAYLVAPASKRFKATWVDATEKCEESGCNIPSIEELQEIYDLRKEIDKSDDSDGDLTFAFLASCRIGGVWSSTDNNIGTPQYLNFVNGSSNSNGSICKFYSYAFAVSVRKIALN